MSDRHMFRAWCPKCKRFVPMGSAGSFVDGELVAWCQAHTNIQKCDIEQCTGLRDKNGVLIYEGDVVQISTIYTENYAHPEDFYDAHYIGIVHFRPSSGYGLKWCNLHVPDLEQVKAKRFLSNICQSASVVIGNIHEHPELVEG